MSGERQFARDGVSEWATPALAAIFAFALMLIVPTSLNDGDTGWHLATGAWIATHFSVPRIDPFSFTATGRPWIAHEWLSELAMYLAWRVGGWSGLILLFGTALGTLYAIIAAEARRWFGPAGTALSLLALTTALLPSLLARPHLLALPLFALWMLALLRARQRGRAPSAWIALIMLAWTNMHGSFVIGLALGGLFGVEALLAAPVRERGLVCRRWCLPGLASALAALASPSGVGGVIYPFTVGNLALLPYIGEWLPTRFDGFSRFEALLLAGLFLLLARPVTVPPLRLLALLYALHLTLQHSRQEMMLVILAILVLAESLGRAWRPDTALPDDGSRIIRRADIALLVMLAAVAIGLAAFRVAIPVERRDSAEVSVSAIQRIPADLWARPVFNEYGFGGALIMAGVRPYIDGRSDMYGDPFSLDYFAIQDGDIARFRAADARWHFGWTILPPRRSLVAAQDRDPAWRRVYADRWAVIHRRVAGPVGRVSPLPVVAPGF